MRRVLSRWRLVVKVVVCILRDLYRIKVELGYIIPGWGGGDDSIVLRWDDNGKLLPTEYFGFFFKITFSFNFFPLTLRCTLDVISSIGFLYILANALH